MSKYNRRRNYRRQELDPDKLIALGVLVGLVMLVGVLRWLAKNHPWTLGLIVLAALVGIAYLGIRLWQRWFRPQSPSDPLPEDSQVANLPSSVPRSTGIPLSKNIPPSSRTLPYHSRRSLLSQGERAIYEVLVDVAAPSQIVLAKVRLVDVVDVDSVPDRLLWFRRISQKHVDFVVCEAKSLRIQLAIELDDRSHEYDDRQERDDFVDAVLDAAGVPIHHIKAQQAYDVEALRHLVASRAGTAQIAGDRR